MNTILLTCIFVLFLANVLALIGILLFVKSNLSKIATIIKALLDAIALGNDRSRIMSRWMGTVAEFLQYHGDGVNGSLEQLRKGQSQIRRDLNGIQKWRAE